MNKTLKERSWFEEISIPAMLRHARNTYGAAMRSALDEAGFDDIPGNGLYVIGGLALGAGDTPLGELIRQMPTPLGELIKELRISKQAAGNLVDTLVTRGYLDRTVDPDDRRKLTIALTERGMAAAAVQAEAREKIDEQLLQAVGPEDIARTRLTLAALCDIGRQNESEEH